MFMKLSLVRFFSEARQLYLLFGLKTPQAEGPSWAEICHCMTVAIILIRIAT